MTAYGPTRFRLTDGVLRMRNILAAAVALALLFAPPASIAAQPDANAPSTSGHKPAVPLAPAGVIKPAGPVRPHDFTLVDSNGKRRTLSSFRGQPVVLYFFCGCTFCQRCASFWGRMQRGGALPRDA